METLVKPLLPATARQQSGVGENRYHNVFLIGYFLLAASAALFCVEAYVDERTGFAGDFTAFTIHYVIAFVYMVVLSFTKSFGLRRAWSRWHIDKTVILLNLFLISAHVLNRELIVFEVPTTGLLVCILLSSAVLLSYRFVNVMPGWAKAVQGFVLGMAVVLYAYFTALTAPYLPISVPAALFFGMSLHMFVPVTLLVCSGFLIYHKYRRAPRLRMWVWAGATCVVLYGVAFAVEWNKRVLKIEQLANQSVLQTESLPVWARVSEGLEDDWLMEKILKSDLAYTTWKNYHGGDFGREVWDEAHRHDPFVFVSTMFKECTLSANDRVKILRALYGERHRSEERLWSGDNLTTSYVVTDVDIYPALRLAYTEKYLNIRNNASSRRWWGDTEEAIYTFQLPEGSAVTSLSLWINGQEEKGILTSKGKATKAYNDIVGVQRRDPSVVHWQEGNTITVRVFPCNREEERKVKIGFTSPLREHRGEVIYKSIVFNGPNASNAHETTRVRFIGAGNNITMPGNFERNSKGDYISEGTYNPNLTFSVTAPPLTTTDFDFNGYRYTLQPYAPVYAPATFKRLYLDINKAWTEAEVDHLLSLDADANVMVYDGQEFITLTADNAGVAHALRKRNFTFFPFHLVPHTTESLVVTKGGPLTPHLSDITGSTFAEQAGTYFAAGNSPYVFVLNGESSTYISSLRELHTIRTAEGDLQQLDKLWHAKQFPSAPGTSTITLPTAGASITRRILQTSERAANGPDHIMRLFAYNDVLRRVGGSYFTANDSNDDIVAEAAEANVVSPVSSLIVLETAEDYKRFDITRSKNSLQNASKNSSGAVPEPHEWALIALFVLFVLYIKIRSVKN